MAGPSSFGAVPMWTTRRCCATFSTTRDSGPLCLLPGRVLSRHRRACREAAPACADRPGGGTVAVVPSRHCQGRLSSAARSVVLAGLARRIWERGIRTPDSPDGANGSAAVSTLQVKSRSCAGCVLTGAHPVFHKWAPKRQRMTSDSCDGGSLWPGATRTDTRRASAMAAC